MKAVGADENSFKAADQAGGVRRNQGCALADQVEAATPVMREYLATNISAGAKADAIGSMASDSGSCPAHIKFRCASPLDTKQDSWWTGSEGVLNWFTVSEPVHRHMY